MFTRALSISSIALTIFTLLMASSILTACCMPVIDPDISVAGNISGRSQYIVIFKKMPADPLKIIQEKAENIVRSYHGEVLYRYNVIDGIAISIPDTAVSKLYALDGIERIEKDKKAYLQMDTAIEQINALSVRDGTWGGTASGSYDGSGIKVLIIDSGVDSTHPDLKDASGNSKIKGYINCLVGDSRTDCYDDNGHGTFVASQIIGSGLKSDPEIKLTGLKDASGQQLYGGPFRGIAPGAELYSAKVSGADGSSSTIPILAGLDWALKVNPDIVSISMASIHSDALEEAVKRLYEKGIVVVVAAGNTGPSSNTIMCPGDSPYVITVGSVEKNDDISLFSSRGPMNTGIFKPDVVACGGNVIAAKPVDSNNEGDNFLTYYQILSGTSMATPEVTGVVALIQQYSMYNNGNKLSPDQVKHVLNMSARHPPGASDNFVRDFGYGYGIVDAGKALLYVKNDMSSIPPSPEKPMATVYFDMGSYVVNENSKSITIKVFAEWSSSTQQNSFEVQYSADSNTAIPNKNYYLDSSILIFNPGEYEKDITITLIDDHIPGSSKDLFVRLSTMNDNVMISRGISKVTILDTNNQIVKFDVSSYTVTEDTGIFTVDVIVDRSNVRQASRNAVTIGYKPIDGTALAGRDYELTQGIMEFSLDGNDNYPDIDKKSYQVIIKDPSEKSQPMRFFVMHLIDPENAILGSPGSNKVCIYYNNENIDSIPPETVCYIPTPPANGWYTDDVEVAFSASDDMAGSGLKKIEYNLNGGEWVEYSGSIIIPEDGENTINFRSVDNAGNVELTESYSVNIDRTPPVSECIADEDVLVILSDDNGGSGVNLIEYRFNNEETWMRYTGQVIIPEEVSSIIYRATDNAGNIEENRVTRVNTGNDLQPPITECIITGIEGNNGWYRSGVSISLNANDGDGSGIKSIKYSFDNIAWYDYSTPFDLDNDGIHTLYYYATDLVENMEEIKVFQIKIDTMPPEITYSMVEAPNANGWYNTNVTVMFRASDSGSGIVLDAYDLLITGEGNPVHVTWETFDNAGNSKQATVDVKIDKTAPVLGLIKAPALPVPVGTNVIVNDTFIEALSGLDRSSISWDWDDGTKSGASSISGNVINGVHKYTTPNIATITLSLKDNAGNFASVKYDYVVVYDTRSGSITGDGWINSPVGAYVADRSVKDKASFSFISKYDKGAKVPTGNMVFHFDTSNFNFKSKSYEWLVISGNKAMFKGTGTINGAGNYGFILAAIDGNLISKTTPDKLRIKIWNMANGEIIYDNQPGDPVDANPTMPVGGGNIVINKK